MKRTICLGEIDLENAPSVGAKVINPGRMEVYEGSNKARVFCKIEYIKGCLSITGVVGPTVGGNARGGCGQIIMEFKEYDERGYHTLQDIELASGWSRAMLKKFFDIWNQWHLNDMRAECIHQREMGWTYETHHGRWIEKEKKEPRFLIDEYATGEVEIIEVFDPYKGHACPVCGYECGSAWLVEEVPQDIVDFLFSLPAPEFHPAWV